MIRELVAFRLTPTETTTVYAALGLFRRHLDLTKERSLIGRSKDAILSYRDMQAKIEEIKRLEAILADEVGFTPEKVSAIEELAEYLFNDVISAVRKVIESEKSGPRLV